MASQKLHWVFALALVACATNEPPTDSPPIATTAADFALPPSVNNNGTHDASVGTAFSPAQEVVGTINGRPYKLRVPANVVAGEAMPILIALPGYGDTTDFIDTFFDFPSIADEKKFLYVRANGTPDALPPIGTFGGQLSWNATDACCAFGNGVDDVGFLRSVIQDVESHYTVDAHRIYVTGHSNGAFMAHRMGCDASDIVTAIVAVSGAQWKDPTKCAPTHPVFVLEIHGTADTTIGYNGGTAYSIPVIPSFPSAPTTVATWSTKNGCTGTLADTGMKLDLVTDLPLAAAANTPETDVLRYNCAEVENAAVEHWRVNGAEHVPNLVANFPRLVYENFLATHTRQ